MNFTLTFFTVTVALLAAIGLSLLWVGYMVSALASIKHGWRWALAVVLLPIAGVAMIGQVARSAVPEVAGVKALLLVASVVCIVAPAFCLHRAFPEGLRKPQRQMLWGMALLLAAPVLLYGVGPQLVPQFLELMQAGAATLKMN